ncbi:MAG: hypothetical protein II841_02565 [Bacteroidales bacterium]|nr:hypothetical protein [Bacteroidales bacterium]
MEIRFKNKSDIFNVLVTAIAAVLSVGVMLFGVWHFGLEKTWPELVLNLFYIACIVMIWMYFFNGPITTKQFNYWCTLNVGMTVLLRDVLFAPPLVNYPLHLTCLTLSVVLLLMLTFFYARKDWKTYSKSNLWAICIIDVVIATLYNIDIFLETPDEYSTYLMVEIWIRPTITYGLVACFVKEKEE